MSIAAIFPSTYQARRRMRKAVWQLRYRTSQILLNLLLLLLLYALFLAIFLISAATVAAERIDECAAAVKVLAAKWRSGSSSRHESSARGLYT